MKPINIIVACAENLVIGRGGKLPWKIDEDRRYYNEQTRHGTLIMGRATFESIRLFNIVKRDRTYVVVTKKTALAKKGITVAASLPEALEQAQQFNQPVWICGGQRIYEQALPLASRLYLTLVHDRVEGDTFFPEWRQLFTKVVSEKLSGDKNHSYTFYVLEKA